MPEKLSQDEFAVLVRRAQLRLTAAQLAEMYQAWTKLEPMLDRIRGHDRGREAEPALIYQPEPQA
jgi:hypothetical protein